ncbi:hypothetical protein B0H17DRAFT_1149949 [Mycena rosella]|uniref:F-box domain-containing protein n=1 Tax=Mycena rosella TaxID=1033263 RepID=A0AAD7FR82_MYCRO|nr:hypothetical protein B0H17DRAFT_1149949 [Mycena rosella]
MPASVRSDNSLELPPTPPLTGPELRLRLIEVEEKETDLELGLARLRIEKKQIFKGLDTLIYPILTLPPEITSEIFLRYVDSPHFRYTHDPHHSPLRLASVCRAWRAVALSTQALWTHFYAGPNDIGGPAGEESLSRRLQVWLPRAGSLPVTLKMSLPTSASKDMVLSILARHSSQWRNLDLQSAEPFCFPIDSIRAPLSSLKKIQLNIDYLPLDGSGCITAFFNAPQLREAHLDRLSLSRISLPWIQLTNLKLWGQSLSDCLEILDQTPNLESLDCAVSPAPFWVTMPAPHVRTMIHLRTLHCMFDRDLKILDHLMLPTLRQLELFDLTSEGHARVESLVARSGCCVQSLYLGRTSLTQSYACLSTLHSLTEITMPSPTWSSGDFSEFFDWMAETGGLLPALKSLNMDRCPAYIDICSLATMLVARRKGRAGAAKLQSFRLSIEDHYLREGRVEQALADLVELRAQGLKVDMHSLPKWATANINLQMMDEFNISGTV